MRGLVLAHIMPGPIFRRYALMAAFAGRIIPLMALSLGAVAVMCSTALAQVEEEAKPVSEDTAESAPADPDNADNGNADSSAGQTDVEMAKPLQFRGAFGAEFDGRWSDRDHDIDLEQNLQFELRFRDVPKIHVHGSIWFTEQVSEADPDSGIVGLGGAGQNDTIRPLYLHIDIDDLWGDSTLRLGRQRILEGPVYNRLDGAYFRRQTSWGAWYAFGGWRASLYDESHNDPAFGGGAAWNVTSSTRLGLDAYYVEETRNHIPDYHRYRLSNVLYPDYPRDRIDSLSETLLALSFWQDITANVRLFGRYTWYEETSDEVRLELTGYMPNRALTYEVAYRRQFGESADTLSDTTAYYRILGSQAEYDNIRFALHKAFGERYALSFETEFQSTDEAAYEAYNRDYVRYVVTGSIDDLYLQTDAVLSLEKWAVAGDEDAWAVTGELSRKFGPVDGAIGVDYQRWVDEFEAYNFWPLWRNQTRALLNTNPNVSNVFYTNNFLVRLTDVAGQTTRENVWALYTNWRWQVRENQDMFADVSYERDDSGDSPYWRLRGGYTIRF